MVKRTFAQEQESFDNRTPPDDGGREDALCDEARERLRALVPVPCVACPACGELVLVSGLDAHANECEGLHEAIASEWADDAWEVSHG